MSLATAGLLEHINYTAVKLSFWLDTFCQSHNEELLNLRFKKRKPWCEKHVREKVSGKWTDGAGWLLQTESERCTAPAPSPCITALRLARMAHSWLMLISCRVWSCSFCRNRSGQNCFPPQKALNSVTSERTYAPIVLVFLSITHFYDLTFLFPPAQASVDITLLRRPSTCSKEVRQEKRKSLDTHMSWSRYHFPLSIWIVELQ